VDSLITIPNEKLLAVLGKQASLLEEFKAANDVLLGAVKGIADLIIRPGMINVDFADVRTVMSEMGMAMMGTGYATGEDRAREAAEAAIRSPLLEDVNLHGARGILVNVTASESLSLGEFTEVGDTVSQYASEDATVVIGTVIDPEMGDEFRVTVVATGLGEVQAQELRPPKAVEGMRAVGSHSVPSFRTESRPAPAPVTPQPVARTRPQMSHTMPQGGFAKAVGAEDSMDYLDIPAFLRRQAD
jgi:cell division protein FtsZ